MITEKDILRYVSTDDTRPSIQKILYNGTHAYATDGTILVRIQSDAPPTEGEEKILASMVALCENSWPEEGSTAWVTEIPEVDGKTEKCETCEGTGKSQPCPSCDGEGAVTLQHSWQDLTKKWHHDDYECDCQHCDGTGRIGGEGESCDDCGGTGYVAVHTHVPLVGTYFDAALLNRLRSLPGLQIHPHPKGQKMSAHAIRGDGWTGLAMPLRAPEDCP